MTNSPKALDVKYCQKCGQSMAKAINTCPSCGAGTGSNRTQIIIIVIAVLGAFAFLSISVIGIIAAIVLPNFIAAQQKAKNAMVKANMRSAQIAAESYAMDKGGGYPEEIDTAFESYYPGGVPQTLAGLAPTNPYTSKKEWPVMGMVLDVDAARNAEPGPMAKGVVEYSVIVDGGPVNYAIRGGGGNGNALSGLETKTLVLSNH